MGIDRQLSAKPILNKEVYSDRTDPRAYCARYVQTTDDGVQVPTLPFRLGGAAHYAPSSHAPTLGENSIDVKAWLDELINAKGD